MGAAVVLLSGGQDSVTCLYWARTVFAHVTAISVAYGQRHARELVAAKEIADQVGVPYDVLDLEVLSKIGGSSLIDASQALAGSGGHVDKEMPEGLPTSFVPGRNLLLLSLAASYAVRVGAKAIVTGVCQTDYSGYPDCREAFIKSFAATVNEAMPTSCGPIEVHTPLMHLTKAETVKLARAIPGCWDALALSVTCYEGLRPGCGKCPACELRAKGFAEAGELDPAQAP